MPFQEILPKVKTQVLFKESVYVSSGWIRFTKDFWKTGLRSAHRARLFYDEDTRQVGMLPVLDPTDESGYSIKERFGVMHINWSRLTKTLSLVFEKPQECRVINAADDKENMKVFSLLKNGGGHGK